MMEKWRARLIRKLGGIVPSERKFVGTVQAEIERGEETRATRLGPTEDDIRADDPTWKPPRDAQLDRERPKSTLR